MKIDSCIIVKNEQHTIMKLIYQFLEFSNEVHITDTGSTDNTIKIINDIIKVHPNVYLHNFKWCYDFAKARNYSLTCYECKADYQFWCDGDDELNDKLVETLKEFSKSDNYDADIYFMKYQYYDGDKNPHNRTSLLKVSSKLKWNDPIHEYIGYTTSHKVDYNVFNNGSLIIHRKPLSVSHNSRNLEIFMNMEKTKYNFSCRNRYYYGRELYHNHMYEYARYQFYKCIESNEKNRLDKINAAIKLFEMKDTKCIDYFFMLFKDGIIRKDLFYAAATYYYHTLNNHTLGELYYVLCIHTAYPINQLTFGYKKECHINSLLQLGVIAYEKKDVELSLAYNKQILKIDPNHKGALDNVKLLETKLNK
jgi:hypothetical protein